MSGSCVRRVCLVVEVSGYPGRMRFGGLFGTLVLIWLLIGVLAAWQRDYFQNGTTDCATAGQIGLTVLAGPLNYAGVNPKVGECRLPEPSAMSVIANLK
ncbi:hypothetical protein MSMEI_1743 [Mycolicibacterium smegmatis MC2 155]|uniref:Uncharacterized protein n=2 Tax=Mycolicibacterium smegmatis TaxID=1772 RepID=I7F9G0_MYCS2|nr:hypothetical protein MSMEI_1743 [Mycolicibacterium smegmatis MC2 155]